MRMTHSWDAWRGVLAALGRSFVLGGALIVSATCLAAPAHAQSKFKVTDGSGVSLDATLSANRGTLTLKGPKGTFVFTDNQEATTATHFGDGTNTGEIQELRWPQTGRGQLIAYLRSNDERVPSQWRAIGNVQPVAAAKPKPKPTPPKGDAFPKRSWRSHNGAIVHLAIRDDSNWMAAGDAT